MKLNFPKGFRWGTSTAAAQVETAFEHQWKGVKAKDGYVFDKTTDHEKRRDEDVKYIKRLGSFYRCGVDWSRLQRGPFQELVPEVVEEYQQFFQNLNDQGVDIMFVFHHFSNPLWFEKNGSWLKEENIEAFIDFAKKCIPVFKSYVFNWNTFNEPNVYCICSFLTGDFPPFKKNIFKCRRALKNMGRAHDILYDELKNQMPDIPVGISQNTANFKAHNFLGILPAFISKMWFINYTHSFFKKVDYWGLSYYANVLFDPFPITEIDRPGKLASLGLPHDKMWGYYPEGFGKVIKWFYKKYKKPIWITENGICSDDSDVRINCIKDYLKIIHGLIKEGVPVHGYTHWSTWDNFEWQLGPTYRFGLVRVDLETMDRTMTAAGEFYEKITVENAVEI